MLRQRTDTVAVLCVRHSECSAVFSAKGVFSIKHNSKLITSGLLAGVVNGLLGSGGGIILVPLFLSWIKLEGKKAFATSVSVTLPLSLATMAVCYFGGEVPSFSKVLPYLIGGAVGGIVAGTLLKKLSVVWLRRVFGALLIIGGVKVFL